MPQVVPGSSWNRRRLDSRAMPAYNEPDIQKEHSGMISIRAGQTELRLPNCRVSFGGYLCGSSASQF
jgi:hypothetical protein